MTPEELAALVDIVRQYRAGTWPAAVTMAWVYGLVSASCIGTCGTGEEDGCNPDRCRCSCHKVETGA